MSEHVLFAQEKHLGVITLNRPAALNALTHSMILALQAQLDVWANQDDVHAVMIQAGEGRAFCAGGDVRGLYDTGRKHPTDPMIFFHDEYHLNQTIHQFKKPYIALMNGITMGGGVGISLHGSHAVASEHFTFAMPETNIGFFPDVGASYLLSQCPGAFGLYLGLTGQRIDVRLAKALKLVQAIIPAHAHADFIASLHEEDLSYHAHLRVNACIKRYQHVVQSEEELTRAHAQNISVCFENKPSLLAIMQTLRTHPSDWAQETYQHLLQKSPTSLAVTFAQLQQAKGKSLSQCLSMDYRLSYHFMHHHDFYEGVRALLIDKDKSPHWNPAALEEITPSVIENYFKKPYSSSYLKMPD